MRPSSPSKQPLQPDSDAIAEREQHRRPHQGRREIRQLETPKRHLENAGDQRHYGAREEAYSFEGIEKLIADFLADVRRLRGGEEG